MSTTVTERLSYPYLVVRKGRAQMPRFRHASLEEATGEASRRAADRPGEVFLVLQEVQRVKCDTACGQPGAH